jgi:hypothetical protein
MVSTKRLVLVVLLVVGSSPRCGGSSTGSADTSSEPTDIPALDVDVVSDVAPADTGEDIAGPVDAPAEDVPSGDTNVVLDVSRPADIQADTAPPADGGSAPDGVSDVPVAPDTVKPSAPSSDLVAWYTFDSPNEPLVMDSSLYGNHGSASEGVQRGVKGRWAFGVRFDGGTSSIHIPYQDVLNITGAITLEAWVFLDTPISQNRMLVRKYLQYQLSISILPEPDRVEFYSQPLGFARSKSPIDFGVWVHVAATHDGSVVRFYINGQLESEAPLAGSLPSSDNALVLGGDGFNDNAPDGGMDEVRIWRVVRSEEEICLDGYGVYDPAGDPVCSYPEFIE